jgi:hypothetical protein
LACTSSAAAALTRAGGASAASRHNSTYARNAAIDRCACSLYVRARVCEHNQTRVTVCSLLYGARNHGPWRACVCAHTSVKARAHTHTHNLRRTHAPSCTARRATARASSSRRAVTSCVIMPDTHAHDVSTRHRREIAHDAIRCGARRRQTRRSARAAQARTRHRRSARACERKCSHRDSHVHVLVR